MQIMITHGSLAQTRVLQLSPLQVGALLVAGALALMALSAVIYHFVLVRAVRDGWPVVSQAAALLVRDESTQRDRFLRENLDAMATRVGEMQAKLLKLEAMSDRVSGLAGVKPEEFKPLLGPRPVAPGASGPARGGQGGPFVPGLSLNERVSMEVLSTDMSTLDVRTDQTTDLFTLVESAQQLMGQAGERQVPGARLALAHGNGGTLSSQVTAILGTPETL